MGRSGYCWGNIYAVRAHIPTWIDRASDSRVIARHPGGIFYDLAGHMLDQIVWLLGRPQQISAFLREDDGAVPGFKDNTLAVCAYPACAGLRRHRRHGDAAARAALRGLWRPGQRDP